MEIKKELQKATILHQQGNLDEAQKIYNEILNTEPNFAEAHHNLGILLKSLNKLNEAEKSFAKAISLKPNFIISHYQMGNTKYKLQKFEESEYHYKKAISIKSNFFEAYINLGRAQRELRKLRESEESLRNAKKINPDHPEVNSLLGLILFDRGRFNDELKQQNLDKLSEGKEILLKSIEIKPDYAFTYLNLGLVYQELGELDEAKKSYEKSLELEPSNVSAKYNLSILLSQIHFLEIIGYKNSKNILKEKKSIYKFNKEPFISSLKFEKNLIDLLYKINSTELNKTKSGPLFGIGKTSDYQLFDGKDKILENVKKNLIELIEKETKSKVYFMDSFFNILGAGGGSVPHHHLNSFDTNFNLDKQKFSLTYYLSVGDQDCNEPGIFKLYDPNEEILPSNEMVMIIPSSRKHSAVYGGKKDRLMIGVNFYLYS